MEVLLLNGSPRAPVSHSKELARMFQEACPLPGKYRAISSSNHKELCQLAGKASHLLLVFPLYVDGIPATLLEFLKALEREPPGKSPPSLCLSTAAFWNRSRTTLRWKSCGFSANRPGTLSALSSRWPAGKRFFPPPSAFWSSAKLSGLPGRSHLGNA